MTIKDLERRIDQLVAQAGTALRNSRIGQYSHIPAMEVEEWAALRAAGLAFIESTFGREHSYYIEFDKKARDSWESSGKYALGILTAVRDQIKGGWVETTKGLVSAEVFADFLEMAEHLLEQKYKDPAAVMVGSVLEEHLRQVCAAASLPVEDLSHGKIVPRKADSLNADLAKVGKYSKLDQKQVTAWLDLRNKAAHGKYSEYANEQVVLMLAGVRDFVSRVRA
ncbi:MAG TPA: hypothetical protein VKD23_18775 [Terriglobales bacterium]|nr:hypothetical protein [Terriglobales bacterium]